MGESRPPITIVGAESRLARTPADDGVKVATQVPELQVGAFPAGPLDPGLETRTVVDPWFPSAGFCFRAHTVNVVGTVSENARSPFDATSCSSQSSGLRSARSRAGPATSHRTVVARPEQTR